LCLELKENEKGVKLSTAVTGLYFKERSHTYTPPYPPSWRVDIILHLVPLSSLTVPIAVVLFVTISVVLFVTISVTATVSL
jgi:hypothetical protein